MTPNRREHDTEVKLHWLGPLRIPGLEAAVGGVVSELERPHVYFYLQEYPESDVKVVYIGKAGNFLKRMFEHYQGFLGLGYYLRNEKGEELYKVESKARLSNLDNIDHFVVGAVQEIKRVNFFCASCPDQYVRAAESALINHVKDRVSEDAIAGLQCDNARREWHGWDGPMLTITQEVHRDFPRAVDCLNLVFGTRVIHWGNGRD